MISRSSGEANQGSEITEDESVSSGSEEVIADLSPAFTVGERVELKREYTRGTLTIGLFALFGITVIVSLVVAAQADASQWEILKDLLQILLPAETGLLGSATGFYFGTRSAGTK